MPEISLVLRVEQASRDLAEVQNEMNKILADKIGVQLKLVPIPSDSYNQQLNLMLLKNEPLDLFVTVTSDEINHMVLNWLLYPLADLLDSSGPDIKQAIGIPLLDSLKINGDIYSIPSVRDWATSYGIIMRKDLADKHRIDPASIRTMDDVEKALQTIKEREPGIVPIVPFQPSSIYSGLSGGTYDRLEDGLGILPDYDNDLKVVNLYETDDYSNAINRIRSWYLAGYVAKDAAVSSDNGRELVRAGKAFSYFTPIKPGVEEQESRLTGKAMIAAPLTSPTMTSSTIKLFGMSLSARSQHPQKAMELLNLLYSDSALLNLLNYGIEGKHYIKKTDQVIAYPPGVDSSDLGYSFHNYEVGNQFISSIWETDDPDIWKKMNVFNQKAKKSKALGFSYDANPVGTEISAVQEVLDRYLSGLETGTLDPAETLPELQTALKAAGIDKIIAEKQKQLDEWAKQQ
ncbi:ABC transporter substrate-binding protein [Paenibacillus sp. LHD-117]|uniref:ABC transporter substrate-binding protein n=1 Tax=Paenibacillus sp. LHD-117 TaxID=3071412 RepID=UPI0027DF40B2|nr:ABC transporter substrate-binding protein [Paenibacillus sp. LHD-117]MDQ6418037.1 ABC transporter substrate-binding protein [Paenibacillus sp. LHD-117]